MYSFPLLIFRITEINDPNKNATGNTSCPKNARMRNKLGSIFLYTPSIPVATGTSVPAYQFKNKKETRARNTPTHQGNFDVISAISSKALFDLRAIKPSISSN